MKKTALAVLLFSHLGLSGQEIAGVPAFSYGFFTAAEIHTLNIQPQPRRPDLPFVSSPNLTSAGAGIGIWGAWPVLPRLTVRPAIQFSYLANTIRFETPDGQLRRDPYRFADLELPLHFMLSKSLERLQAKALILFGGRLSWNLAAAQAGAPLRLRPERLGLDIGLGAGFRLGNWDIQPEVIYSYGLTNSHDYQNSLFDQAVGRVLRDRLSLRLVFVVGQD